MLTGLRVKHFKAWRDTGEIRLAPLTVIFGTNSSGKSSLGHLLLALKQTTLLSDRKRALHLGDETTLIDLGTFEDCIFNHDLKQKLEIELSWLLPKEMVVRNPIALGETYSGHLLSLRSSIQAGKGDQPQVSSVRYVLSDIFGEQLRVEHNRPDVGSPTLETHPLKLVKATGRAWPIQSPEKFYRFSDVTLARYQNAGLLADFAVQTESVLGNLYYLGPLRSPPKRIYQWSGEVPTDVGQLGEFAISALLAAESEGRAINRGPKARTESFAPFIAKWLKDLGVIASFKVAPVAKGRKEFEVLVKTHSTAPEVKLTDVGFGVSQVLPALVEAFYAPPNSTVWMEQPEIHLHPQVQAELADVFISATKAREEGRPRNMQLIVESHSEHLLTRLQRRVAEGAISPNDVAIYFCGRGTDAAKIEPLMLDEYGEITNWPDNFFGDEMADIKARALSGLARKKAAQSKEDGNLAK